METYCSIGLAGTAVCCQFLFEATVGFPTLREFPHMTKIMALNNLRTWFLKRFSKWFSASASDDRSEPDEQRDFVVINGSVARFLFEKRELFAATGLPKAGAFVPDFHPELMRYELSVCGLNGVQDDRLWHLGNTIRTNVGKKAIAAIELSVARIHQTGLTCAPMPEPDFAEHGVVLGWDPDPDSKSARLLAQQDLAAAVVASNVRRPPAESNSTQ